MISKFFSVRFFSIEMDIILLLFSLVVGFVFLHHGWQLIQHPTTWMGAGSPVPGFLLFLAALSEFGGAISWILDLLTA